MNDNKHCPDFDDFLNKNPQIDPAWREFMEPVMQGTEDDYFAFIMSYIFM